MFYQSRGVAYRLMHFLFALMMMLIAVATIFLDKNVNNLFPNTVAYANGGYYLIALVFLVGIFYLYKSICGSHDINAKFYKAVMIILPLAVFCGVQVPVGKWIYWYTNAGDFGSIMYAAIGFNNGETFADWTYFLQSPNNANLAIILSFVYKIIPNWRHILILGAALTNISAILAALTVRNITKNRMASLCTLIWAELLMAMTWRAFIVYTDNYGMVFVALILWVYSSDVTDQYKVPVIVALAAIGTFIKATIFICFLAILIHRFYFLLKSGDHYKFKLKRILLLGTAFVMVFGLMFFVQESLREHYKLDLNGHYPKAWQYMFMVGQNSDVYGVTNSIDPQIRNEIIEEAIENNETIDYVNKQFLSKALQRIKDRGIIGNLIFYTKKLNVAYNDGYFHNVQTAGTNISNELKRNLYYDLLVKEDGAYYQLYAGILQIVWNCILLLLMCSVLLLGRNDTFKLFEILILGITAYLMLFEGRSKYLYMFLPVFASAAGISFSEINGYISKMTKAMAMSERPNGIGRKKIGIITFHFVNNFGGALQAYALRKVVEKECSVEAELIDYQNWFICLTDKIRLLPITGSLKEMAAGLKTMNQRFKRRNKFENFATRNNKLSKRYLNRWQINRYPLYDDKYICGSDQIWNPILTFGVNSNYFLGFESDLNKKIAYAPSFGTNSVSKCFEKKIRRHLESIKHLSVREKSGQALIKSITGREAERFIDPTFLLRKEEWMEIMGDNPLCSNEPYILLYIMQRDFEVYEYAKKMKEQTGIQLVEISRYGFQPGFVDKILVDVGPAEFLRLFKDASYICTNSYHGLAYSIIFEKDFCLIPCKRFKARINNMLELLQIQAADGESDGKTLTAGYDRNFVRGVIEQERAKAIRFLAESVGNE